MAQYRLTKTELEHLTKIAGLFNHDSGADEPLFTVDLTEVPEGFTVELVREEGSQVAVEDLEDGDMVDLQNDPYADPEGEEVGFEFEYATVDHAYAQETGVLVYFQDIGEVTFPGGHTLRYGGHRTG